VLVVYRPVGCGIHVTGHVTSWRWRVVSMLFVHAPMNEERVVQAAAVEVCVQLEARFIQKRLKCYPSNAIRRSAKVLFSRAQSRNGCP